jgi:hypothetical protein
MVAAWAIFFEVACRPTSRELSLGLADVVPKRAGCHGELLVFICGLEFRNK